MNNRIYKKISLFMLFAAVALLVFTGNLTASAAIELGKTPMGISMTYYDDMYRLRRSACK